MANLPVIVGIGGMNSAGRSSGAHSYKRMVSEVLSQSIMDSTWRDLADRMGLLAVGAPLSEEIISAVKAGTLIRKVDNFDPAQVLCHHKARIEPGSFIIKKAKLPTPLPPHWKIRELENNEVSVTFSEQMDILLPDKIQLQVTSAGNIPAGFDPGKLYNSHHHPRGLKLAVYGASDMLNSLGLEWAEILTQIKPDEVAVYAGSAIAQVDENSLAGLFSLPLTGNRINSKMIALSLPEMAADFVNSYMINSVGTTGANIGACATFLYNLRQGIMDIQAGKAKVVIVGNAEAPITPEIIEGFRVMGALATDEELCALDNSDELDNRRACRPFSTNCGFTIAEGAQFVVLMDEQLALQLGTNIYGAVADVFVNADANKKSIAAPGIGNYITFAKTVALAKAMLGADLQKTYVQAHGTGTPQNRVTESHILNETAKTFGIKDWPVAAIKSYVGHTIGVAAGDQLVAALGVWQYGWIPGIKTIDHIAEDVHCSHLKILMDHHFVGEAGKEMQGVIINSKGFGGNNATALILSPHKTLEMLQNKYGKNAILSYKSRNEKIRAKSEQMDQNACEGKEKITYQFGESVMDEQAVSMTQTKIKLSAFETAIDLPAHNPFQEYEKNSL